MGDRAALAVTVYTCPDQATANKILEIANEYGLATDWGADESYISTFRLGQDLVDDQASLGNDEFVAMALQRLGVVFKVTQDAKYEFPATLYYGHPKFGLFQSDGSTYEPMIPASRIDRLLEHGTARMATEVGAERSDMELVLRHLSGRPWRDAIKELESDELGQLWCLKEEEDALPQAN